MKGMDSKILIIVAVLIVVVGFMAFSGDMSGFQTTPTTTTITVTTSPPTTTVYTPPPTTTVTEETTTTIPEETTNETAAETCNAICMSEGFSEGKCRPSCLQYEDKSETEASDCTGIYKCCCD